jgi:hypothetical protein
MKKIYALMFLLIISLSFASAQTNFASGLRYGMEQLIDVVENLIGPLLGAFLGGEGDFLFERVLFFVIILSIVYLVLGKVGPFKGNDKEWLIWIIAVTVSLLATRFLIERDLIQAMILPYSVLGVALSAALPFLIYVFFVHSFDGSPIARKILWVFFIVVFIGIWASRPEIGNLGWIYLLTAVLALFFLLFDGTIRRAIVKAQMAELNVNTRERHIAKLRERLEDLRNNERHYRPTVYRRLEKRLMDDIKRATKI